MNTPRKSRGARQAGKSRAGSEQPCGDAYLLSVKGFPALAEAEKLKSPNLPIFFFSAFKNHTNWQPVPDSIFFNLKKKRALLSNLKGGYFSGVQNHKNPIP